MSFMLPKSSKMCKQGERVNITLPIELASQLREISFKEDNSNYCDVIRKILKLGLDEYNKFNDDLKT